MNRNLILIVLALAGVGAGSYWLGTRQAQPAAPPVQANAERKVLYYRNPMGLPDTSPVPKKDSMGMDYVPVYEGEAQATNIVSLDTNKVQKLGVKSEPAALRTMHHTLRASGRIEIDERRVHTVAPKFEGWVEHLFVNSTGQVVAQGQPLFEVYSPELVSARREHALATQGLAAMKDADAEARASMQRLADASASRLKNWNITEGQADEKRLTFHAPATGVVLEKKAVAGMRFMPGERLYQIADLSTVWVIADVPEQDIGHIAIGSNAQLTLDAYPGLSFKGQVDFVYPTLNGATRTVPVRITVANPKGQLKPAMFAQVELRSEHGDQALAIPVSAVIDSGTRQVALVRLGEGRFEPRAVQLGTRSEGYVEVLSGLREGEQVVTSANFLIDAESNLKAALGGISSTPLADATPAAAQADHSAHTAPAQPKKKASPGHKAQGVLEGVNEDGTVSITHQPISSLGWPGMTMDFALANAALVKDVAPGSTIEFEIVERKKDEWVIVKLKASASEANHAEHHH